MGEYRYHYLASFFWKGDGGDEGGRGVDVTRVEVVDRVKRGGRAPRPRQAGPKIHHD
jgi:hypothetical protein